MISIKNYCNILATLHQERLALSKGRKGGLQLNLGDVILHLVDELMAEKEKNFLLQQNQQKQVQDEKTDKG